MCGIHGIVSLSAPAHFTESMLDKMGDVTRHRGPDDSGSFIDDGVAIGMRRLSIIDLSGGHQPISNNDQSLWLVCNGEIYNYKALRKFLIKKGYVFKTESDVEVIIHLYDEYGVECLHHLNGMFAFALWDVNNKRLMIARDRMGIKPLYYSEYMGMFTFSTEAKAILSLGSIKPTVNRKALRQYLELGYVSAPLSMFDGINKLEVASYITIESGVVEKKEYWRPTYKVSKKSKSELSKDILSSLEKSVVEQMVSDVPLGAFLSGGVDSSAIVGLMAKHSKTQVKTYAIGFDTGKAGKFYNELPYARQVSELFGTDHKEIIVRPDVVSLLPKLLWHMDEPVADSAFITTYLVSKFAREDSTVILSGVGGDELFAGYRRYLGHHYISNYKKIPGWIRKRVLSPLVNNLPVERGSKWLNYMRLGRAFVKSAEQSFEKRYKSYIEVFSSEMCNKIFIDDDYQANSEFSCVDVIEKYFKGSEQSQGIWRMFEVDRNTQLPDDLLLLTDKMSMAVSLECRVPFLDHELVELATQIPEENLLFKGELKHLLKSSLSNLLPDNILNRPKRGFGAPMGSWLKEELSELLNTLLNRVVIEKRGFFNWEVIRGLIEQHMSRKEDHTDHLMALINFEIWCKLFIDGQSYDSISTEIKGMMV